VFKYRIPTIAQKIIRYRRTLFHHQYPNARIYKSKRLFLICFFLLNNSIGYAYTNKELSDNARYAIPLTSGAVALLIGDFRGFLQLSLSTVAVQGTTEGLKYVTHEKRPRLPISLKFRLTYYGTFEQQW